MDNDELLELIDELLELISDVKREASNNQKLTIARGLILDIAKNCIDAEKQEKLLIASELLRMFV